jgi:aspartate kinase
VGEKAVADLYQLFAAYKIKPNLIQTGAVSIHVCIDDVPERNERLAGAVATVFDVMLEKELTLITIRHDQGETLPALTNGKTIELLQRSPDTVQALIR